MNNSKKLVSKFFYWGLILIIIIGLNFLNKRGLYYLVGTTGKALEIYTHFMGIIYNISTILIPIICMILFKLVCDIIYLFITLLENK